MSFPMPGSTSRVTPPSLAGVIVNAVLLIAGAVAIAFGASIFPEDTEAPDAGGAVLGGGALLLGGGVLAIVCAIILCAQIGRALAASIEKAAPGTYLGMPVSLARWLVPLIAHIALIGLVVGAIGVLYDNAKSLEATDASAQGTVMALMFAQACLLPVLIALGIMLLVRTIGGARASVREGKAGRSLHSGKLSKRDAAEHTRSVRGNAAAFRQALLERRVPPTLSVWDVPAREGEVFFADGPATYARYYGRNVSYNTGGGFWFGSPTFVLAGLAATAIGNASAKNAAEREAMAQWRDWQQVRLVVTNQRIICLVGMQWVTFDFSFVASAYPDIPNHGLVLLFEGIEPLLLQGDGTLLASIMSISTSHGERGLREHPGLAPLDAHGQSAEAQPGTTSPPQLPA